MDYLTVATDGLRFPSAKILVPENCPMCKRQIFPKKLYSQFISSDEIIAVYLCNGCKKTFLVKYSITENSTVPIYTTKITWISPNNFMGSNFSEEIIKLSPKFVKIYHQAERAEQSELDEICGMGYRLAIEFLTKDYFIQVEHKDEKAVKSQWLGQFFNPQSPIHFEDDLANLLATCVDIANNHSHYRKDDAATIQLLKYFIKTFITQIEHRIAIKAAKEYAEQLKQKKKQSK